MTFLPKNWLFFHKFWPWNHVSDFIIFNKSYTWILNIYDTIYNLYIFWITIKFTTTLCFYSKIVMNLCTHNFFVLYTSMLFQYMEKMNQCFFYLRIFLFCAIVPIHKESTFNELQEYLGFVLVAPVNCGQKMESFLSKTKKPKNCWDFFDFVCNKTYTSRKCIFDLYSRFSIVILPLQILTLNWCTNIHNSTKILVLLSLFWNFQVCKFLWCKYKNYIILFRKLSAFYWYITCICSTS